MALVTGRRGLLGVAALAAVSSPAKAADARDNFTSLRLGANLERWFPIAADNRARRLGRGWWEGLRAAGFDHARLFIPREATGGDDVPRLFLTAIEDALATGMRILIGMADLYESDAPWDEAMRRTVAARARLFSGATDPAKVALAALNEPAFPDAAAWRPQRDALLQLMRTAAPRHVLLWGGHEWCSWRSLMEQTAPADPLTIAEVHDYLGGETKSVAERFGAVAAWGRRQGCPVMVTELGGALDHGADENAWAADLRRSLPELRRLGLPAALWAITHGSHWRLQRGEGPSLRPALAAAVRS